MFKTSATIDTFNFVDRRPGSAYNIVTSALPRQPNGQPGDLQPVSAPWAQVLGSSLYRLLEGPNARYSAYRDLLTAVRDFRTEVLAVRTQQASEANGQSDYAPTWVSWAQPGIVQLEHSTAATSQTLELDIGAASPTDHVARGAATLTLARGRVMGTSFVADSTRSVSISSTTSLRQLADAINGANGGVTAALSGTQLILTGDNPGARNAFRISLTGAIRRDWSFNPALYDSATPPSAVTRYRPAADAVTAGTDLPSGFLALDPGGGGSSARLLAGAVNTLLSAVAKVDSSGILGSGDSFVSQIETTVRAPFFFSAGFGANHLSAGALGLSYAVDGVSVDVARHLSQYAADPVGTRSALEGLATNLADLMSTPVDDLGRQIESLRQGVLLGVSDGLVNGSSLADAVTAYAEALVLGTWVTPRSTSLARG